MTDEQKQLLKTGEDKSKSLQSQEHLTVKGNEQRTMLMQKLMKTRIKSSVIVLK